MNLLQRSRELTPGYNPVIGPDKFPLKYLKLGRVFLTEQLASYAEDTGGGYRVGYLWALAGEERTFGVWSVDSAYAWLSEFAEQE